MKKVIAIQIIFIIFLLVLFSVYKFDTKKVEPNISLVSSEPLKMKSVVNEAGFNFLNPIINVDLDKHYIINFKGLRSDLVNIKNKYKGKTFIYFVYLNNSSWIGLDEKELFPAASTIKTPLAMAIYKMEEQGKIKPSDVYSLSELDLDDRFGDLYKIGSGSSVSLEDLVGIMLQYSDNTAMRSVIHTTDLIGVKDPLKDVYMAMGWDSDIASTTVTYININLKTLANMFLALYNSSYISPSNSQKILNYLSLSQFNDQIVAGVPKDITIAHKIGINDPENAYSDCGIVYAPNRHYILCVGSVGLPKKDSDNFIKQVSKSVYDYVINN